MTDPTLIASTDGVQIALHDLGGNGPQLLLTHATGFCGRVWEPVAAVLADHFHCWAPDLRGHGDAITPDDLDMSWTGFADDVTSAVEHLAATPSGAPSVAAGHSKGGAALLLAEQARPGTFGRLYCYEPVVFPTELLPSDGPAARSGGNFLADGARRRRDRFDSRADAIANYSSKPPLSVLAPDALAAYVDHGFTTQEDGSIVLKCRPENEARTYEMGGQHRAFDHLTEMDLPVTLAAGERDAQQGPGLVAPMIAERIPDCQFVVEPGLGHFGPLEDPPRIAQAIATALT
jgi:pimeloyl-ACP methyl ester carboxylesterase